MNADAQPVQDHRTCLIIEVLCRHSYKLQPSGACECEIRFYFQVIAIRVVKGPESSRLGRLLNYAHSALFDALCLPPTDKGN